MIADDLTAFLRNDRSLKYFLDVILKFGNCAGLSINLAITEMLILGNTCVTPAQGQGFINIEIKEAVKILGVYFSYNRRLRNKLNFEGIIDAIKTKLQLWRWRNQTIIGRIQIVKTFVIPMLMYRAGSICIDKEVIIEAKLNVYP